jgi:hypothetical protein
MVKFVNCRRDSTMASVLMVIVILFFLCHSSRIIVNFYEALQVRDFATTKE